MHPNVLLLDAAVKASVVLAAAFLITLALRNRAASARYLTWICALAAVLLVPVFSIVLPAWEWTGRVPATLHLRQTSVAADEEPTTEVTATHPSPRRSSEPWLALVWLTGLLAALTRLGIGHLRMQRSVRRAAVISAPDWRELTNAAAECIGFRKAVVIRLSNETDVPLTCGIFKSTVVLPAAAGEWDAERRRIVLLHELTHVRRRDPLLFLTARVAGALYWFHPLVWLAVSRFRREQEKSCDDAVVRAGARPSAYAASLVRLAQSITPHPAYSAALHMAATSDLEQRVRALLNSRCNRQGLSRRACLAASAAVLTTVAPFAAVHAQDSRPVASLSGSVLDASGSAVPGVLVLLQSANHQEAARANDAGEYSFVRIRAGSYRMQVKAPGFAEFDRTIALHAGIAPQMNVTLDVGAVSEALDVVGKAPRVAAAGTPKRIRVGGNVQATKLISIEKPAYPPGALAASVEGTVLLRAVISVDGTLLGTTVLNSTVDPELAGAALNAVKHWRYQPTLLNGAPVEVVTTIAVTFRLD
ncbi:MAG: M56 family metallopeptidase [Bryobacteraceae bacterium]